MIRVVARRSNDVSYFTNDPALELDGLRDGGAGWWLRGRGDTTDSRDVGGVLGTTERSAVQGYDIIVAAPRPISILVAVDPDHGAGVVAAHRESVSAAVAYLEEHSLVVRDRRDGGDRDESGRWRSIVSFTHGVNRHG
ncbi:MAG TPA: relaxase domain-containing protein, partial [Acidimicrobiales bacterium]